MSPLSPSTDTLEQKFANKEALQEELGWTPEPKRAMICLPTGVSEKLGGELLKELMEGLLALPLDIVILGKGSASYGEYLTEMSREHDQRIAIVPNDEKHIRKMFAAADMSLFLTDATDLPELQAALRYGTVPVCPNTKKIKSYDPNQESGEGFFIEKMTVWHSFAAIVRALETFKFPFDWRTIQRHCVEKSGK